jgi:hypothetical protein
VFVLANARELTESHANADAVSLRFAHTVEYTRAADVPVVASTCLICRNSTEWG